MSTVTARNMVTLSLTCDNAAFGDNVDAFTVEVARILRSAARMVTEKVAELDGGGALFVALRDTNGNSVGSLSVDYNPEE